MNTILLILCSVITLELFLLLKIMPELKLFQNCFLDIKKILFSKQVSDLEKEKIVRKYSLKLLIKTVKIFLSILVILLPFILLIILDYFIQFKFLSLLISLKGFLISFAIFIIYGNLRSYVFK